jgi:protein phosphatase
MGVGAFLRRLFGGEAGGESAPSGAGAPTENGRIRIRSGKYTSIGYFRENNEDRVAVDERSGAYIVADGMGGQAAGEQASQMAVDLLVDSFRSFDQKTEDQDVRVYLARSVVETNRRILDLSDQDPALRNMGTTLVMALIRGNRLWVASLGDSRAYRIRDGRAELLTTDHNLAQVLLEAGTISAEEMKNHRFKNRLYKFLGSKEADAGPDIKDFELRAGDRFLLASDGLTGSIEDDRIGAEVSAARDPQKLAEAMVQEALDQGSRDNVTCIVIFVEADR